MRKIINALTVLSAIFILSSCGGKGAWYQDYYVENYSSKTIYISTCEMYPSGDHEYEGSPSEFVCLKPYESSRMFHDRVPGEYCGWKGYIQAPFAWLEIIVDGESYKITKDSGLDIFDSESYQDFSPKNEIVPEDNKIQESRFAFVFKIDDAFLTKIKEASE